MTEKIEEIKEILKFLDNIFEYIIIILDTLKNSDYLNVIVGMLIIIIFFALRIMIYVIFNKVYTALYQR